jgi:hypothetical protein
MFLCDYTVQKSNINTVQLRIKFWLQPSNDAAPCGSQNLQKWSLKYTVDYISVFNLILPCVLITGIALLSFYMPSDSGEKVSRLIYTDIQED